MQSVEETKMASLMTKIIHYPPIYPKTIHIFLNNTCNLNCPKCYYKEHSQKQKLISLNWLKWTYLEWKTLGVESLAFGGGEPLLHPDIKEIISSARQHFFVAITTNGTVLKNINPHRIHISYDEIHPTWGNIELIQSAIDHYHDLGCKVGINHVVTNIYNLEHLRQLKNVENVVLLREKPNGTFQNWQDIPNLHSYWLDACISGVRCEQGIMSFHLDYDLNASICSNHEKKVKYTSLDETWRQLKLIKCPLK